MKSYLTHLFIICIVLCSCKQKEIAKEETIAPSQSLKEKSTSPSIFEVIPVSHATMVVYWEGTTIYIDPVGGAQNFSSFPKPDLILITDIHGDHLNVPTLEGLETEQAKIIVPQAVADKIPVNFTPQIDVLNNGDTKERFGFSIEAVPMYNLRKEALKFHAKGRGNGYVIEKNGKRIYISGDTEDIPEMRALKDIDIAFVCMNLPYTMTEISAANAVLEFSPKQVYPYHYRGTNGLSDVDKFKEIVNQGNAAIDVVQLDWYPQKK